MYTSPIQPYSRRKDGRGEWFAITIQYAGKNKGGAELNISKMTYLTPTSGKVDLFIVGKIYLLTPKRLCLHATVCHS